MAYDIEQVKTVYDELTAKVKADLDKQFNKGRLKGTDYANVYSTLMNTCLQLAFEAPMKEAQIGLIKEQQITERKRQDEIEENIKTLQRQRRGFDDNFKFKMFDSQMNAWAIMFSSGMLDDKPSVVSNDEVSKLYNNFKSEFGIE